MQSPNRDRDYHEIIAAEYHGVVVTPRAVANDVLFSEVDAFVPPGGRMLDLGCGTGHMLVRYAARFGRALGVDHSEAMLAQARKQLAAAQVVNAELRCQDLLEFLESASGREYDFISCVGCLHHLEAHVIEALFGHVHRLLRRDAVLLFAEPIVVPQGSVPGPVAQWNARSIAPRLRYSVEAQDPEEAPLEREWLMQALARSGLAVVAASRGWELFPHAMPPTPEDRENIRKLHRAHGSSGNVFCAVAAAADSGKR